MSHFTVTVRITEECLARHGGDHHAAVKEILVPYQENNMGDCPQKLLEFHDADEPALKEGQTREGVMEADGYKQHPNDAKRWGYWENPNKKWDWWVIGGRWRGFYPIKAGVTPLVGEPGAFDNESAGGSDVVAIGQIDMDMVATKEREAFEAFKAERVKFLAGAQFDPFEGPRAKMLDLGLLRVEQDPSAELQPGEVQVGKTWGEENPNIAQELGPSGRAAWRDIAKVLSDAQFEKYRCAFNPLLTYAMVDDHGWCQPGRMGCSGARTTRPTLTSPTRRRSRRRSFVRRAPRTSWSSSTVISSFATAYERSTRLETLMRDESDWDRCEAFRKIMREEPSSPYWGHCSASK